MNETLSVASVERISAGNANLPSKLVVMPLVCPPSLSSTVAPTTGAPLSSFTAPFRETGFPPPATAGAFISMIRLFSILQVQSGSISRTISVTGRFTADTDTVFSMSKSPLL